MGKPEQYRQNAENCRTLAIQAGTEELRIEMLDLAAIWDQLAVDYERVEELRRRLMKQGLGQVLLWKPVR